MDSRTQLSSSIAMAAAALLLLAAAMPRPATAEAMMYHDLAVAPAAPNVSPFQTEVMSALNAMNSGRYSAAADTCSDLIHQAPQSPLPYELRGALALMIGDVVHARADFQIATMRDPDDPVARYGQAMQSLMAGQDGRADLARAERSPNLSAGQTADCATLRAYIAFVHRDWSGCASALQRTGDRDDPTQAEVSAMLRAHLDTPDGIKQLTDFLATPSGVPTVVEPSGLRMRFDTAPAVEPDVLDPLLQTMYVSRLRQNLDGGATNAGPGGLISGHVQLDGPRVGRSADTEQLVVDGRIVSSTNVVPFSFDWDSKTVANGPHTVRIDAFSADGARLDSVTRAIKVYNPPDDAENAFTGNLPDDVYAALRDRVWKMLRVRPSYRVAEQTLSRLEAAEGDKEDAAAHSLVALALAPFYQAQRDTVAQLMRRSAIETSRDGSLPSAIQHGDTGRKWIALTFDDGPNPVQTPRLLKTLEDAHVAATFFVVGARAQENAGLVRRMAADHYDVENHSYTHPNIAQCVPSTVESEILRTSIVVHSLTGRYPAYFRPPGGDASTLLRRLASEYGLTLCFWTIDVLPAEDAAAPAGVTQWVLQRAKPGAIVLMHNAPDATVAAIPDLARLLRARGYRLVTLRQMMGR